MVLFSGCGGYGEKPKVKNGIYASCGNYDFTIYRNLSTVVSIRFYLTCEDPLPEGTEIQIDMNADYSYVLQNITPETITSADYPYSGVGIHRRFTFGRLKMRMFHPTISICMGRYEK